MIKYPTKFNWVWGKNAIHVANIGEECDYDQLDAFEILCKYKSGTFSWMNSAFIGWINQIEPKNRVFCLTTVAPKRTLPCFALHCIALYCAHAMHMHMNKFTVERRQYFLNSIRSTRWIERKCNKTKGKNETTEFNEIVLIGNHLEFESIQFRWMSSSFVVFAVECWAIPQLNQPYITIGLQTDIVYSKAVFWRLLDWTGRNWTRFKKCLKSIFMLKKVKRTSSSS